MSSAPTTSYYALAKKVYNSTPASAGYEGWICTTAGYANNVTWTTGTLYTINQRVTSGINVYQCTVVGAGTSTNQPTGTSATAVAFADGDSWLYLGALAVFRQFGAIV